MNKILIAALLLFNISAHAQPGVQLLKKMHSKNYNKWYKTMTFIQTTEFYRNDSLMRKATWYEAVKLPYDLRIDMEDPARGNFVLYKKDTTYRFQNRNLRNAAVGSNPFLFFIGGMYFMPFDSVKQELKRRSYDINKGYATQWEGRPAYVIGRANESDSGNAIWLDTENLWFVRMVEKDRGQTIDAHMKEHKKLSRGSSETKVDIYINGKLVQVEKYDQLKPDVTLDDSLFDPVKAAAAKHWFQ
jgi:hypothetical protein